jgi:hypothetical protein
VRPERPRPSRTADNEEETMAIVVLSETPNMTKEQYDIVAGELGLSTSLPNGCLAYIAGMAPDGSTWRDVMVWERGDQAKEFMDTLLRPAMERAGAHPIWGPPTNWEAHTVIV